jgi:hypothetical protein
VPFFFGATLLLLVLLAQLSVCARRVRVTLQIVVDHHERRSTYVRALQ